MNQTRRAEAFDAVERFTEIPMLVLSLAIIPLILVPLIFDLSHALDEAVMAGNWLIWGAFAFELAAKTYLAPERRNYLIHHWFDILIVFLPFLRPLRLARTARAARALESMRVLALFSRATHSIGQVLESHGLRYVLLIGGILVLITAGAMTVIERNAGGNINNFEDGIWWALTTVTTVGYGDRFPVTPEGRGIAVFLMLVGITLFSVITANIAAYLVQKKEEARDTALAEILLHLHAIEARLDALQQDPEALPLESAEIPTPERVG